MNKITIVWGTDKDKTKTYTFKNDEWSNRAKNLCIDCKNDD